MLTRLKRLAGYKIRAADGEIGKIKTVFFDDQMWAVRYLVADTGGWLAENLVLLHPTCLAKPNPDTKTLPVTITKKQIEASPSIAQDRPVSKQKLADVHSYYDWPIHWAGGLMPLADVAIIKRLEEENEMQQENDDPHLRSAHEIVGYRVRATDGDLGTVHDFVVGSQNWNIRYMIADLGNWLPGKKVLISPHWIRGLSWEDAVLHTSLGKEGVENSPKFDPSIPLSKDYEQKLYQHYGRSLAREREKFNNFVT